MNDVVKALDVTSTVKGMRTAEMNGKFDSRPMSIEGTAAATNSER